VNKLNISVFSVLTVVGLALLLFLLWSVSLLFAVDRQNQLGAEDFRQQLQLQIGQLQQNQRAWLQSQFYSLNTLARSAAAQQNFQSLLLDYYQHNPSIWAVNLLHFDAAGKPVSSASKPGCLQPREMNRDDYLVPVISSCRIDDKALLEIVGPVAGELGDALLLVSMDYFEFLNRFSMLSGRRLQRAADGDNGIQYQEFSINGARGERVTIAFGDSDAVARLIPALLGTAFSVFVIAIEASSSTSSKVRPPSRDRFQRFP